MMIWNMSGKNAAENDEARQEWKEYSSKQWSKAWQKAEADDNTKKICSENNYIVKLSKMPLFRTPISYIQGGDRGREVSCREGGDFRTIWGCPAVIMHARRGRLPPSILSAGQSWSTPLHGWLVAVIKGSLGKKNSLPVHFSSAVSRGVTELPLGNLWIAPGIQHLALTKLGRQVQPCFPAGLWWLRWSRIQPAALVCNAQMAGQLSHCSPPTLHERLGLSLSFARYCKIPYNWWSEHERLVKWFEAVCDKWAYTHLNAACNAVRKLLPQLIFHLTRILTFATSIYSVMYLVSKGLLNITIVFNIQIASFLPIQIFRHLLLFILDIFTWLKNYIQNLIMLTLTYSTVIKMSSHYDEHENVVTITNTWIVAHEMQ